MHWTLATPDATTEPPRPKLDVGIVVWHPQYWDLHVWMGEDDTPIVSFANPKATGAALHLPDKVNYRLVNGRREPVSYPSNEGALLQLGFERRAWTCRNPASEEPEASVSSWVSQMGRRHHPTS